MLDIQPYDRHTKFGEYDYLLEDYKKLTELYGICQPKLVGEWRILCVDPSLKDAKSILDDANIPKYFHITLYVAKNKIGSLLEEYPEYAHKDLTPYEVYQNFLTTLNHSIESKAAKYAFRAANGNLDELEEALKRIDDNCNDLIITLKGVMSEFTYTKRIYTSQVLREFLTKAKYRFNHYTVWLNELGTQYAYNSMYKTVKSYVNDKANYLKGKEVKNKFIAKVDGIQLSVLYTLFLNSTHYSQLESILYTFDSIDNKSFRRLLDARFQ